MEDPAPRLFIRGSAPAPLRAPRDASSDRSRQFDGAGAVGGRGNAVISTPSSVDFCQITLVAAGPTLLESVHLGAVDNPLPLLQREYLYVCTMLTKAELGTQRWFYE